MTVRLSLEDERAALANCEDEPIRTPGVIQPHGMLLAARPDLSVVTHVSENAQDFMGRAPHEILGEQLNDLFDKQTIHQLRNIASLLTLSVQRESIGDVVLPQGTFNAAIHLRDDRMIIELTPPSSDTQALSDGVRRLRWMTSRWTKGLPLFAALDQMVRDLRAITGYDRVMAYRFRPDGSGEVIAEDLAAGADSYLGLRFPSQDIPRIAREICMEQPLRVLCDVGARDVPIMSLPQDKRPLDLTLTELRGTSPVHASYLQGMGVRASLVLPVIVEDQLWGLFSCHHAAPRRMAISETLMFDLVSRMIGVQITNTLARDHRSKVEAFGRMAERHQLFATDADNRAWQQELAEVFRADGLHLQTSTTSLRYGVQPSDDVLATFAARAEPSEQQFIHTSDDLMRGVADPGADAVAGIMEILPSVDADVCLRLFRKAENHVVEWAGAPDNEIETVGEQSRLLPRSSFEAHQRQTEGCSRPWEPEDIATAHALRGTIRQWAEIETARRATSGRNALVVRETSHRMKNVLALTQIMVDQSAKARPEMKTFLVGFKERLASLIDAYTQFEPSETSAIDLRHLIETGLAPYGHERLSVAGPSINLSGTTRSLIVLLIHEMITNAAKHGSLSRPEGEISIRWALSDNMLDLNWVERGGPTPNVSITPGFGKLMINEVVTRFLDGESTWEWKPEGLEVWLRIPVRAQTGIVSADPNPEPALNGGHTAKILVLEDDLILAFELRSRLRDLGYGAVTIATSNEEAIAMIDRDHFEFALLDVNLLHETSAATADKAKSAGLAFAFLTGYAHDPDWAARYNGMPQLAKPVDNTSLSSAIIEARNART